MGKKLRDANNNMRNEKKRKYFLRGFIIFCFIFMIGLIKKEFQNDTFYTIKIGELILKNGIDMMDHFSFHTGLAYTYPHWLYDVFIYLIYKVGGFTGIYISSIMLFIILITILFKLIKYVTNNLSLTCFITLLCCLSVSGFITARAQSVTFIIFALEVYFIEKFLDSSKKRYLVGLLILSLLICNLHVAVWPFYFVLYMPYLVEYLFSLIKKKIKIKKENKFIKYLDNKFIVEENKNVKILFVVMIASLLTGFMTPLGTTPFTYFIKTAMGNSQEYIEEHKNITWATSPFTIIMAAETIFLTFFSKAKLRDFFMICGLVIMSIVSVRHMALLAVIGSVCFARVFGYFFQMFNIDTDMVVINFFSKKLVCCISFIFVIIFSSITLSTTLNKDYVNKEAYPTEAVKYIKNNLDIDNIRLYNEYNFGSYLLFNDIKVFIDSRADLYTKQFSGFDYDIFDDYHYSSILFDNKMDFYGITHLLTYKSYDIYKYLEDNDNYSLIYDDEYFALFERKTLSVN